MSRKLSLEVQSLIDAQDSPFVLIDEHYSIVAANKAYQQTYGTAAEDIIGRSCHEVSHHSPVPCHMNGEDCPHRRVFSTGQPHQVLHVHYDNSAQPEHVRIKAAPIYGSDGARYLGESLFTFTRAEDLECEQHLLVGRSKAFLDCMEKLTRAADSDTPVLLYGESGVGKELAAQFIHSRSHRHGLEFVAIDCSKFTKSDLETQLFGKQGDKHDDSGHLFQQADGGTLFLNEIGSVPLALQGRLLRVLESGHVTHTGDTTTQSADVRIVGGSSRDLRKLVAEGRLRADFFYHVSGFVCEIPPLRVRHEDIAELAGVLLKRIGGDGSPRYRLSDDALEALVGGDYPGNLHELRNVLQCAAALSTNGIITAGEIRIESSSVARVDDTGWQIAGNGGEEPSMRDLESRYIAELLAEHQGKRARVAEILGISERTLYRKLKRYGLQSVGRLV